jgi:hypothetical protein
MGSKIHATLSGRGDLGVSVGALVVLQFARLILAIERGWKDRALGTAALALDLGKGVAEAFGPLKAVLATISVFYDQCQVRP